MKAGLGPDNAAVIDIALSPVDPLVVAGEVVLIHAEGRTSAGAPAPLRVDWAVSDGTLIPMSDTVAEFSASTPGVYQVYARGTEPPYPVDSTSITVVAGVSPTVSIALSPDPATLSSGEAADFTVTAFRDDGSSFVPGVTYTATGGSVTSGGLYTAGSTTGTYRVIATQQGGTLADTAVVFIVPPAPPGANPHEPAGMTVAFDEAWNSTPNGRTGSREWITDNNPNGGGNFSIVSDPSAPVSPGNVLQVLYPAGKSGGSAPAHAYYAESGHLPANTGLFYTRVQIQLSSNWSDNGNSGTKFFFPRSGQSGENAYINLTSGGTFRPAWSGNGQAWNASDIYYISGTLTKGVWHDMEILLYQGTSASAKNGYVKIWVDGVLLLNQTGLQMLPSGAPLGFNYLFLDPTYGGGTNPVPADQYFRIDHWYASVK